MRADPLRALPYLFAALATFAPQARGALPLDDAALAQVSGRGLSLPLLQALARQDESNAVVGADASVAMLASTAAIDDLPRLQRQLEQPPVHNAAIGARQAWRLAQAAFGFAQVPALGAAITLPGLQLPFFGLPFAAGLPVLTGLPSLPLPGGGSSDNHRH